MMNKHRILELMQAFVRWQGWRSFGALCVRGWKKTVRWPYWKKLFRLPGWLLSVLCAGCGAGLLWVFATGKEASPLSYGLYVLSAYALTALCTTVPSLVRGGKAWLERHPAIYRLASNGQLRFALELYVEQFVNFAYGIFKIVSGVVIGSAWVGADGIYNLAQAIIQLFQILRRKKSGTLERQWRSYRFCGVLILLMHLTLTGIVFQMVNWNRVEEHGQIMVIGTAAFAFYKFISSFVDVAKDRKHAQPIDSSVRMLELSQAIFAMFSLQASMLHTFGTGEAWEGKLNLASGSAVCLLVAAMGVYMICRGSRQIRKLQERDDGEQSAI